MDYEHDSILNEAKSEKNITITDVPLAISKNIDVAVAQDISSSAGDEIKYSSISQTSQSTYEEFKSKLLNDPAEEIISIAVKSSFMLKTELELLKFLLSEKKMIGITICIDRPASFYIKLLESKGLRSDMMFFIDAISLFAGKKSMENAPNIVFLDNPGDLTSIDITITKIIETMEQHSADQEKFLLLSCLPTLLLYVESTRLGMFIHDQISKLRINGIYGTILLLDEHPDNMLNNTIKAFCDNNIVMS